MCNVGIAVVVCVDGVVAGVTDVAGMTSNRVIVVAVVGYAAAADAVTGTVCDVVAVEASGCGDH